MKSTSSKKKLSTPARKAGPARAASGLPAPIVSLDITFTPETMRRFRTIDRLADALLAAGRAVDDEARWRVRHHLARIALLLSKLAGDCIEFAPGVGKGPRLGLRKGRDGAALGARYRR